MRSASLLLVLSTLAAAAPASAQTDAAPAPVRETWVSTGFGVGYSDDEEKLLVTLEGAHRVDEHLFVIAIGGAVDLFSDSLSDFQFLYGRVRSGPAWETSVAAGLAFTADDSDNGIGVPIRLAASWRPLPILGLGVRGLANVSSVGSYVGLAFVLELGDLR